MSTSSFMLEKRLQMIVGWAWPSITCTGVSVSSIWCHTRLDSRPLGKYILSIVIALSGSLRPDCTPGIRVGVSLKITNISTIGHPGAGKEEGFGPGKRESSLCGLKES